MASICLKWLSRHLPLPWKENIMLKVLQLQNEKIEKKTPKEALPTPDPTAWRLAQTSVEHGPPDRAAKLTLAYQYS